MLFLYIISSVVISALIFFIKNNYITKILMIIFLILQGALNFFAFINLDKIDSIYYKFDSLGILFSITLMILSCTTFYHTILYFKRHEVSKKRESLYYSALILLITAMMSVYFAQNIAILWVSVESTTLFVSVLIYHERTQKALEATWKYLFVSSLGVAIAFIGILFLSMAASNNGITNLNLENLVSLSSSMNTTWLKISFLLVLTGFSAKMGIFPLYTVAIDAHTVAPPPISALISTALMNVGFLGIFRIFTILAQTDSLHWVQNVLIITGVASIFMSSIQMLRVKHHKRLFAFSSLEHMGLVTLALGIGGIGYYAAILHIIFHSFVKSSLFYQIGQVHHFFNSYLTKNISGYFKLNPIGGLSIILGVISILAIPPSGLFVSEFLIFKSMFLNGYIYLAIFVMFLLTIIIYTFSKNNFSLLYDESSKDIDLKNIKVNRFEAISLFVLLGLVIYLGLTPPVFFTHLINNAVSILIH